MNDSHIQESDPFHALSIEETFQRMETSSHGLSTEEVKTREERFGKNVLQEEKRGIFRLLFRQFQSFLIYILFAASLMSLLIGAWTDFFVINAILLFNGLIGFWQELKAAASIAALKKMTESKNQVIRDGKDITISSTELVPGDFVIVHEGDVVTADIRLTHSTGLMIDESSMTGESVPISKDHTAVLPTQSLPYELTNMLLTGTVVVRGTGQGVVVRTAENTYLASIAKKVEEPSPDTPLNKALQFFSSRYVFLLVAIFIILGIVGYFQGRSILGLGYILLAGLVSAVPEGLPIVVTLVMVLGAFALSRKKTLIRSLPSVETLGSVTIIASDKTGTITEGKLAVKQVHSSDEALLKQIAALCNDAHGGSGDPLDLALAKWVGDEYGHIRESRPRTWAHSFDTRLRLMATVNRTDSGEQLLIKGAFEALKDRAADGQDLTDLEKAFSSLINEGLRVIALGTAHWEGNTDPASWRVQLIGLVGFLDPPKEGVKEAVEMAKKAGIHVVMITGDHPMTARAVAQQVGIWSEKDKVLCGKEIEEIADSRLLEEMKHTTVFARILPEHKYRIVKILQESKEIVAVTGDGVNDMPALRAADIGIAMGSGTDAAKGISDMVITDNNLQIIVEAVRNARIIADNIRKVIYYLCATSFMEVILIVIAILSHLPLPLVAIQILWINIVTDGVMDKFFPFAKEEGNVMLRKPRRPNKQFFDAKQVVRIVSFGVLLGGATFFLYLYLLDAYSYQTVTTIIFTSVVFAQWANGIQAQKESEPFLKNIGRSFSVNPLIFLGLGMGIILQIAVLYFIPDLFHSVPLTVQLWKYPLWAFLISFGVVEIRKWVEYCFQWRARAISKKNGLSRN